MRQVGVLAAAGLVAVVRALPTMWSSFSAVVRGLRKSHPLPPGEGGPERNEGPGEGETDSDLPSWVVVVVPAIVIITLVAVPGLLAGNMGLVQRLVAAIGVAIFGEKQRPIAIDELRRKEIARNEAAPSGAAVPQQSPAAPASEAQSRMRDQAAKLGTGYGRSESSYASYTQFERASDTPSETITIFYDSYQNLLAQGVPVAPPVAHYRPNPFPEYGRFVPDLHGQ